MLVLTLIVSAFATTGSVTNDSQQVFQLIKDGKNISSIFNDDMGVPYIDQQNRTMVPLRAISEAFGYDVDWDNANRTALIEGDNLSIKLPVGQSYGYVNNKSVSFDTKTVIKNDRTYVPLRFVGETLNYQFAYKQQSGVHVITISSPSAAQTSYPLTLTDGEGRSVTIKSEPQRVISVAPSVTEIFFAIGAGDKLVGRTDYCNYPAKASDVTSIGTLREPNIEKIAELEPDIVIVATHFKEEAAAKLEELGITVFVLKSQESFDGVYKTIDQAGQIANSQTAAQAVIDKMKDQVSTIVQKVKGLTAVSCYYVVGFGDNNYTATGDTFMHELLTMAGGDNVAKDGVEWSYSLEKLIEHDPQIIMVNNKYDSLTGFTTHVNYQGLSAVKEGRVYEVDGNRLSIQGPRLADALQEVAMTLHPEAFK